MEPTTIEEQRLLNEFRKCVDDLKMKDSTLLRFLRARRHNLKDAEQMIRNHSEWRRANDLDNMLKWNIPELVRDSMPYEDLGFDFEGNTVIYINIVTWLKSRLIPRGYLNDVLRLLYQMLEKYVKRTDTTGQKTVMIFDTDGLSFSMVSNYQVVQANLKFYRENAANYPEVLSSMIVINAPYIFNWFWSLAKPCLSGDTVSRTEVYGSMEEYMPVMVKRFPVLPTAYREKCNEYKSNKEIVL